MKHKIIIEIVNGRVVNIATSGETEIVLIEKKVGHKSISIVEPDLEFENGKAHELYSGEEKTFIQHHKI